MNNDTTYDPTGMRLRETVVSGWVQPAPDTGRDAAVLLLATTHDDAADYMPLLAAACGINPAAGNITVRPDPACEVRVSLDRHDERWWVEFNGPGGQIFTRPVDEEWTGTARADGRVIVFFSYAPQHHEVSMEEYTGRLGTDTPVVIGIWPLAA